MRMITILALITPLINVVSGGGVDPKRENITNDIEKRKIPASCEKLDETYRKDRKLDKIKLMFYEPKTLVVVSTDRAPSRALAALLVAAIRYKAGYINVQTDIDNRNMKQLAYEIEKFSAKSNFVDSRLRIYVDADWVEPESYTELLPRCKFHIYSCSIAGPRLLDIGRTPSVNLHVYSFLSENSLNSSECLDANTWSFYKDKKNLQNCDFLPSSINDNTLVPIFILEEIRNSTHIGHFQNELNSFGSIAPVHNFFINSRFELNLQLQNFNTSFIFIDYELGYEKNSKHIQIVQLPPQPTIIEPIIAMRLADQFIFHRHAPMIEEILSFMTPQPEDLYEVLNIDATLNNIEDAACRWASDNQAKFETWTNTSEVKLLFLVILCKNSDQNEYNKLIEILNDALPDILKDDIKSFTFNIVKITWNCSDVTFVHNGIRSLNTLSEWEKIAGVALPGTVVSKILDDMQFVYYDIPPPGTILSNGTSTTFGSLQQLTKSVSFFFKKQGWSRIAIISEKSDLAKSITSELAHEVTYKEETLISLDVKIIAQTLQSFKKVNARVFYINAGPAVASLIICEAAKLGMVADNEYAWIAREWRPSVECQDSVQVFSVSYWWRGSNETWVKDYGGNPNIRRLLNENWKNTSWPILAAPMVDAILLMLYRMQMMLHEEPERFYDIHSTVAMNIIAEQLNGNGTVSGVVHKLGQVNHVQRNSLVYVTAWRGNVSQLVAVWRIQHDANEIEELNSIREVYYGCKRPDDGKTKCITSTSGDEFYPTCHDPIWPCIILLLVIIIAAVWKTRQAVLMKFKKQERETLMRLLSRCEKTAAVLEPYLVDRSALELYEELGSGHYGRVRFGMLRARNHPPTPVAAKALREDAAPAEEAEFLREASTLATLSHDHIVGLVGVCADAKGPPLLLMEHAFFADLLKYLRQRRHLVEINERNSRASDVSVEEIALKESLDPEARHVSSTELTRLAREAAQALDYLGSKHLAHRDIRAANCLIDARRVLKLADFGMARSIEAKTREKYSCPLDDTKDSADYKYICCRRGVFPVPWMAPESLERGEFSRASDIWALGVMMLEIATLGARPYGSWNPMQVFRFVRSGGRPPLPVDASYHTCEITEMCWTESPAERASARQVVDYLEARPDALRGALRPAWPEPNEVPDGSDSGFGTTEQDWPKGVDLRVSTL